ncbi:lactate utilization protein B [Massilia sp. W12]|uniref:lactate utilization protein B n=1 Tax=Massilia sp. W12 TaxID=3126507 RepID=UPI0030CE742E
MQSHPLHFKPRAAEKLADAQLQRNLRKLTDKFVQGRAQSIRELEDFEATREAVVTMRQRALDQLDIWLEIFEEQARARGAQVLYAETPQQAAQMVLELAQARQVRRIVKTKSMVSEEIGLNAVLQAAGMQVLESDLGEYILQINDNEAPSHIVAPVVHKDKEEIARLFERVHGSSHPGEIDIPALTREARLTLRPHFLAAEMCVTGGNFLIAETGSVALVTNEGNEGMCTLLAPRLHVAIAGIEKVLPTLSDLASVLRLLPRSAVGQSISNYVSLLSGPRDAGAQEGPQEMVFILLDGGRSALLETELREMLRCIRCGACMNHCPVYQKIGGHAYGWVYPGPMGSVLTPAFQGLHAAPDLPQAATLCGECQVVCPVKIPLPELLRKLREMQFAQGLRPRSERAWLAAWAWLARQPRLYRLFVRGASAVLRLIAGPHGMIRHLPIASGWRAQRDMRAPDGAAAAAWQAARRKRTAKQ